jgi:diguanylate cyclase (GGDEF)-like protein/PAS domain S-box-containing protein
MVPELPWSLEDDRYSGTLPKVARPSFLPPSQLPVLTVEQPEQYCRLEEILTGYAILALSPDGRFAGWNSGAELMFGYAAKEILGHGYALLFTCEDVASGRPEAELAAAVADRGDRIDGWHVRRDGTRFWCVDALRPLRDAKGALTGFIKLVRDATDSSASSERLRESEERLRLLIEGVTDYAIFSIDIDGTILLWNSGAEHVFGYAEAEVVGKHFSLIYTSDAVARGIPEIEIATAGLHGVAPDEGWHIRRGGDLFYASGEMTRLRPHADGKPRGFVKIAHDITTRIEAFEAVKRRAFCDPLTLLPNRTSFSDFVVRALCGAKECAEARFGVIFVDLDRFKNINDSLGPAAGDDLLVQASRILTQCVGAGDIVARLGGDLFGILLHDIADADAATCIAERIEAALEHSIYLEGFEVYQTASMGISIGSSTHDDAEHVLRDADTALYEAKGRGCARHVVFDGEMRGRAVRLLRLQMDLRRAIARREFFNVYQPIVSLQNRKVVGFEALVRWNHSERGILCPDDFISEAESIGLIVEIDRIVLQEACRQIRAWQLEFDDDALTMSVNLSSKHFAHQNLLGEIRDALHQNDLTARSLKLEITETVLMEQFETTVAIATQLSRLGVELYIDDFGTGHSSLSRLMRLPLDVLKVDRSFVSQISLDPRGAEIVRTVVTLAHNLGLAALAEGIETEAELTTLWALGCEFGQGYWFSRPVAPEVAGGFIGRRLPEVAEPAG